MELKITDAILQRPDLVFWAFLGAFVLYALNRIHEHQPFSLFKALNIDVGPSAKPGTILSDMVVSSAVGALVVFALTLPGTGQQAIAGGLGMTGILSAATRGSDDK